MGKNEKTSLRIAKIASKVLRNEKVSKSQIKSLAGSVLTQAPDKKRKK